MGLVNRPHSHSAGDIISASETNDNENTLYTLVNANLDTANLSASAGIVDTQLAQLTTTNKVALSALTAAGSYSPTGTWDFSSATVSGVPDFKLVTTTRDISTASGNQTITGAGFTPRLVLIMASLGQTTGGLSIGFDDGTNRYALVNEGLITGMQWNKSTSNSLEIWSNAGTPNAGATGYFSSFNSDGGVIAWTKSGSASGTATLMFLFIK